MPLFRTALIATAACLIGAAAYAQTSTTDPAPSAAPATQPAPDNTMPPAASSDTSAPATGAADQAPASTGAMNAAPDTAAPVGAAANTSTTVDASGNQVIASQPVPDTKANRAAYGSPLSNAGKHTAPAGN